MRGKAAKLLRRISALGGGDTKHLKKIYKKMNHKEKGQERLVFEMGIALGEATNKSILEDKENVQETIQDNSLVI
jgi:hypothetical protein